MKVEWHWDELFARVGFIVTNMTDSSRKVVKFYNGCGTEEHWIEEGKYAVKWTRLSCGNFRDNQASLQPFALTYQPGELPASVGGAAVGEALVADDAPRKADQDRNQGGDPLAIRDLPNGRGGSSALVVCRDPRSHPAIRCATVVGAAWLTLVTRAKRC